MKIKDIAQYEDTDSELAKYTITILQQETKRLHSIIKEAREYIENPRHEMSVNTYQGLLEILDKVEEK